MSHHIYQTSGFILGSSPFGEANRSFRILTKDLGLVKASAQGARFLKSKLRYSLQDFSQCDFSLVRGKTEWRLTGAQKHSNLYDEFRDTPEVFLLFVRVFSLLDRLLSGEEKNETLFQYVAEAVSFARTKQLSATLARHFEYILVLRILSSLGYLGSSPDMAVFVESPYWSDDLLAKMGTLTPKILGEINKSLKETQL